MTEEDKKKLYGDFPDMPDELKALIVEWNDNHPDDKINEHQLKGVEVGAQSRYRLDSKKLLSPLRNERFAMLPMFLDIGLIKEITKNEEIEYWVEKWVYDIHYQRHKDKIKNEYKRK